jgi:hypothetical protein
LKITVSKLIRWAGLSALLAGMFYVLVGMFHPLNVPEPVATSRWAVVHIIAIAMSFFGLLGMAGLYARQAEKAGWLGLAGFFMLSLWLVLITGFTFVESFVLPSLVTAAPEFVEGFLGMFTDSPSEINLGILPTLWLLTGPLYMFGGLLFGIATFRAGILPRWAGVLLALGTLLSPVAALFPPEHEVKVGIPVGLALAWLGFALLTERRAKAADRMPDMGSPLLGKSGAR